MTKKQIERKINCLQREILYLSRVYPGISKIQVLKSKYRYYKKLKKDILY